MFHPVRMEFSEQHRNRPDNLELGFPTVQTGDQLRCNVGKSTFNLTRKVYQAFWENKQKVIALMTDPERTATRGKM